jgi:hypothetical protein
MSALVSQHVLVPREENEPMVSNALEIGTGLAAQSPPTS